MSEPLSYASVQIGQRLSKLALAVPVVGASSIPIMWVLANLVQEWVDFGDSVTRAQAIRWALVGATPGFIGMGLAIAALVRIVRAPARLCGIPLVLLGLFLATVSAIWGSLLLMVSALENS